MAGEAGTGGASGCRGGCRAGRRDRSENLDLKRVGPSVMLAAG